MNTVKYAANISEKINQQSAQIYEEYMTTSKIHFIKRKGLLIAYEKLNKIYYETLLYTEKIIDAKNKKD